MNAKKADEILYALILIGVLFRFFYPLFSNPNDHLYSDPYRHYHAVQEGNFGHALFSFLDPLLPQLALKGSFFLFGNTVLGAAIYNALLCAAVPLCWYLWAKYIFNSKTTVLIYTAIITYLPSWIGMYSLFMDENPLLPLLGIALWLSWRAAKLNTAKSLIMATIVWAVAMCTKLNITFELVIVMAWLMLRYWKIHGPNLKTICISLVSSIILVIAYLSYPFWVYTGLGFTWIFPPGMGAMNRAWHNSNGKSYTGEIVYKGKVVDSVGMFGSNGTCSEPFSPFCKWSTWRDGQYDYRLICDQPITISAPYQQLPWRENLRNATEETLHLFFSQSWPDCRDDDPIQIAQCQMRWIWSLITLATIFLAIKKGQQKNILVVLSLGTLLLYIISNSAIVEGRYRKPWEGIGIAALVYLCAAPRKKTLCRSPSVSKA